MDNTYRFQLITLDESAKQAIQMEELIHFQETSHTEIEQLEHVLVHHRNPCPLGKVRVQRFYRLNSG